MEPIRDDDVIAEFVVESKEHLSDVEAKLLAIEASGAQINVTLVNEVFRAVHSIKGAAGFLGFDTVGKLAHELENVLNLIRNEELVPNSLITDALLRASDRLAGLISDIDHSNDVDVSEYIEALERILAKEVAADGEAGEAVAAEPAAPAAKTSKPKTTKRSRTSSKSAPSSPADPSSEKRTADGDTTPSTAAKNPRSGKKSTRRPTVTNNTDVKVTNDTAATERSSDQCASQPCPTPATAPAVSSPATTAAAVTTPALRSTTKPATAPATPSESRPTATAETATEATSAANKKPVLAETSIRVSVGVLDRLMNLAGELVLSRNQLLRSVSEPNTTNLDTVASRMDQVTSELQETIMQARMQPVGTVFNKFPRVVRDLSRTLDKQCELRLEGSEVELDKSIIEAINDPLTHLIRNSVDHGIESPAERAAQGKPACGTIVMRAYHQAGKVNITISDDGKGIDASRLREKAVARGLITSEQASQMSDREAVRLIFRPAFSTAETVSSVSGRGVGMDVVKTNIEKLGGTVNMETQLGTGSTAHIKLPLTLAIIPSLVVWAGGQRFAIPQAGIRELVRVRPNEIGTKIQSVKGAEVFRLRGQLIPLLRLAKSLGLQDHGKVPSSLRGKRESRGASETTNAKQASRSNTAIPIIFVETGHLRYGLVVDGLQDSEEIVVKPLGRHMQDCPFLAGATILGDGAVAMILDVSGIASHCQIAIPDEDQLEERNASDASVRFETQTVLLFRNAPSECFAIPMDLIDRVERINVQQIDSVGGQLVLQYRGSSLPLFRLEHHVNALPAPDLKKVCVAVFQVQHREYGLVIPELVDIVDVETNVDMVTFIEPGVMGSVKHNNSVTRLIDPQQLVLTARPEWFATGRAHAVQDKSNPRILLAEDSDFFRKQLANFLESAGYEVVSCENGQIAWDILQLDPHTFHLLLTDLEMPVLDGLNLARRVKAHPSLEHLPIVAVTSLASDDDIQRGKEAGIDEYHVKLERDSLLETLNRLIHQTHQPVC